MMPGDSRPLADLGMGTLAVPVRDSDPSALNGMTWCQGCSDNHSLCD